MIEVKNPTVVKIFKSISSIPNFFKEKFTRIPESADKNKNTPNNNSNEPGSTLPITNTIITNIATKIPVQDPESSIARDFIEIN